ncbi:MAG TPA: hypothetical protein VFB63_20955 [Bryobacteraceae bacterium]|nr:hypothetical protein [Bryobacteraceae bacterium]
MALPLLFAGLATSVFAVDGVVLIDQNRALAGNVTPGDTPGFPVTLSQPGSYRLSGNLSVPSGQNAILIAAQNITIDLNGFSITTPVQLQIGGAIGIVSNGIALPNNIKIHNGTIEGFIGPFNLYAFAPAGYQACRYCILEDLNLRWGLPGASSSIDLGMYNRVRNVTASTHNINVFCPSVVTGVVAQNASQAIDFPGDADSHTGTCVFADNSFGN